VYQVSITVALSADANAASQTWRLACLQVRRMSEWGPLTLILQSPAFRARPIPPPQSPIGRIESRSDLHLA
jgi:hypothetical protein